MTNITDDRRSAVFVEANTAYYDIDGADSPLSDTEFDAMNADLRREYGDEAVDALLGSPVGAPVASADVTLTVPMLSLNKATTEAELDKWIARIGQDVEVTDSTKFVIQYKWDGLPIQVRTTRAGALISAATRGDGFTGQDVTESVRHFWRPEFSTQEKEPIILDNGDRLIHGEVVMSQTAVDTINAGDYGVTYTRLRSAASGILKRGDARLSAFLIWRSHSETASTIRGGANIHDAVQAIWASGTDVPVDGVVIKIASPTARESLGVGSKAPHWALAFKFPDKEYVTTLREVRWSQGRIQTTPVAVYDEIRLDDGAVFTKATLHNPSIIQALGLHIGDTIAVVAAKQILPKIIRVVTPGPRTPDTVIVTGANTTGVSQEVRRVDHALVTLGIKEVRQQRLATLVESLDDDARATIVTTLMALYQMSDSDYRAILGEASGRTAYRNIQEGMLNKPGGTWLAALGIPSLGRTASAALCDRYGSLSAVAALTSVDEVSGVEGIGSGIASEFFANKSLIEDLVAHLSILSIPVSTPLIVDASSPLMGRSVVITGDLGMPRDVLAQELKARGAVVKSSVSKRTELVLVGPGSGQKAEKAEALGIPTVGPAEVSSLLDGSLDLSAILD